MADSFSSGYHPHQTVELQSLVGSSSGEMSPGLPQSRDAGWTDPASEQLHGISGRSGSSSRQDQLDENVALVTIRSIELLRRSLLRDAAFAALCLASGGVAALVCYWRASWYATLRFARVAEAGEGASHVLVESLDSVFTVCPLETACAAPNAEHGAHWKKDSPFEWVSGNFSQIIKIRLKLENIGC